MAPLGLPTPMARIHGIAIPLLALAAAGLLASSGTASAMYVITPLRIEASHAEAEPGDIIDLTLERDPEHEGRSLAGETVLVRFGYDRNEPRENETHSGESDWVYVDIGRVTLNDKSAGALSWTIPAEVDDHNAFLTVLDDAGQTLGSTHVRVGDATPMMFALRAGTDKGAVQEETPAPDVEADTQATSDVPAPGLVLGVVALAAVALLVSRRR